MKYFGPFVILSFSFLIISFTTGNQNKLKTGFYYLAKTENDGQIVNDVDSEDRYAVDQQEVLNTGDFKAAKIVTLNAQPNRLKTIQLTLTKNGRKKWVEIQNRMSKTEESLLFIYDDKVYFEETIIGKSHLGDFAIDVYVEPKYQQTILNAIRSEIGDGR